MPKPYQLILFDFDGTLVDTVADIAHYANLVLERRGFARAGIPQVQDAIGWGVHELLRSLAPPLGRDPDGLEKAVDEFKTAYSARPVVHSRPFPGVTEALDGVLKSSKKAIVTNKPQDITALILEELGLSRYFEDLVGLHAGFPPKPDPSGAAHLMKQFGASPDGTVYVGDSCVDAETSRAAGMDFAYVEYGYQVLKGFEAEYRFSTAAQWAALVS